MVRASSGPQKFFCSFYIILAGLGFKSRQSSKISNFLWHDSTWACYLASAFPFSTFWYALGLVWRILAEMGQIWQKHVIFILKNQKNEFYSKFSRAFSKTFSYGFVLIKTDRNSPSEVCHNFFHIKIHLWTLCPKGPF